MYTNKGNKKKGKRAAKQQKMRDAQAQQQADKKAKPANPVDQTHADDVAVEDMAEEREGYSQAEFIYKNIFYEWFYRVPLAHPAPARVAHRRRTRLPKVPRLHQNQAARRLQTQQVLPELRGRPEEVQRRGVLQTQLLLLRRYPVLKQRASSKKSSKRRRSSKSTTWTCRRSSCGRSPGFRTAWPTR